MKTRSKVLFLLQRIGPYHHARLVAFAERGEFDLIAVEYRADETVYVWDSVASDDKYSRQRLSDGVGLRDILAECGPAVIVCVGYSDSEIHGAMCWALKHHVPLVTCSDSTFADERRLWVKELSKRALIGAFDAALVAGRRSREYLGYLGLPPSSCFQPWDVVDNSHFEEGSALAREDAADERRRLGLPQAFFLSVGRFVWKKNIARLVEAYRRYVATVGSDSWGLVLAGSGPLKEDLRRQTELHGIGDRVSFVGLAGYDQLPCLYGLAHAFVMPSISDQWGLVVNEAMAAGLPVLVSSLCGCASDLVEDEKNGFLFNPDDVQEMAALMVRMHRTVPERRREMGRRSREIIAAYSPKAFASGLAAAVQCALEGRGSRKSLVTHLAVRILAARTP